MNQLGYAALILTRNKWPTSTVNLGNIARWCAAEEPPTHWWNTNDPLNFEHATTDPSGAWPSLTASAQAVADVLASDETYAGIAECLATSASLDEFSTAVVASPWSEDHYGGTPLYFTQVPYPTLFTAPGTGPNPQEEPVQLGIAVGHVNGSDGPTGQFLVSPAGKIHIATPDDVSVWEEPPFTAVHVGLSIGQVDTIPEVA